MQSSEINTPYLFAEFTTGTLFYSENRHSEVLLNYHRIKDQMVVAQVNARIPIDDIERLDSVRIDGHVFIKKEGSWLEIRRSKKHDLLIKHHATMQIEAKEGAFGTKSHSTQVNQVAFGDQVAGNYDLIWSEEYKFLPRNEYFFITNAGLHKANNLSQVAKIFAKHKKAIKNYALNMKVDFKSPDQVHQLFLFCDTLSE
ncbi:MAG: hypothetical protein HKN76_11415 [Saprospiraceae bacterium]|nr:hypothetical protein [Saprospiraceae bacterium]